MNGDGRINREDGLGRRRTDLFIEWPLDAQQGYLGPIQRVVIELKILHKSLAITIQEGLEQTADYAQRCNADEAHLMIFDRRKEVDWDAKIWRCEKNHENRLIQVWGA